MRVYILIAIIISSLAYAHGFILPIDFQKSFALHNEKSKSLLYYDSSPPSIWSYLSYLIKPLVNSATLQKEIDVKELNKTAWDLYNIANLSVTEYGNPTRVIGSPGHQGTIEYILKELNSMDDYYDIFLQNFNALIGKVNSYNLSFTTGEHVQSALPLTLSPPVDGFNGKLVHVPNMGCSDSDYQDLKISENQIALVGRGKCSFGKKSELAGKYGFKAVILINNDSNSVTGIHGSLEQLTNHTIATISISLDEGMRLIAKLEENQDLELYFSMDSSVKEIMTTNIIADTKHGDPKNIVALGAHSDSVVNGPGINDDGSGIISLLTVARHLSKYRTTNMVRFAWWSAEEEGLLGSKYYVEQLNPEEKHNIRLFMDYDMMASPNYEYQVYDANNQDHPKGSEELKNMYIDYYTSKKLNYTLVPFDGRSDYVAFIENGIPGGGVATGAEGLNRHNGKVLDECYHMICDDVSNIDFEAFLVNTKLIAHSVGIYGRSLNKFPKREFSNVTALSNLEDGPKYLYSSGMMVI